MQNWTKLIPSSNIPLTHVSTTFGKSLRGNASYLQIFILLYFRYAQKNSWYVECASFSRKICITF